MIQVSHMKNTPDSNDSTISLSTVLKRQCTKCLSLVNRNADWVSVHNDFHTIYDNLIAVSGIEVIVLTMTDEI